MHRKAHEVSDARMDSRFILGCTDWQPARKGKVVMGRMIRTKAAMERSVRRQNSDRAAKKLLERLGL